MKRPLIINVIKNLVLLHVLAFLLFVLRIMQKISELPRSIIVAVYEFQEKLISRVSPILPKTTSKVKQRGIKQKYSI